MKSHRFPLILGVLLAGLAGTSALAALLGVMPGLPRASFSNPGVMGYTASTGAFSVTATPTFMTFANGPAIFSATDPRTIAINIVLANNGTVSGGVPGDDFILSGSVTEPITGNVYSGTLLTGEIVGFGYRDGTPGFADQFDFRFTLTGGLLSALYAGQDIGVTLTSDNGNTFVDNGSGSGFLVNFGGNAKGAVGPIPKPPVLCTGSIGNYVWHDENRNGIQDVNEHGINGVAVTLTRPDGSTVSTTTGPSPTGQDGYYQFSGLCAGTYTVTSGTPVGYSATLEGAGTPATDSNPNPSVVVLPADNSTDQTIDFGFVTPCAAAIGDFVWLDLNGNGIQEAGENGINGVTVDLLDSGGTQIATTTTGNHPVTGQPGYYLFDGLCAGVYQVRFHKPAIAESFSPQNQGGDDTVDSDPDPTTGVVIVNLPNDTTDLTVDAGVVPPPPCVGRIGDFVWNDINANGVQDPGEPGIDGVKVQLLLNGVEIASTFTTTHNGQAGFYEFDGLNCNETYMVVVTRPAAYAYFSPTGQGTTATDSNGEPNQDQTLSIAQVTLSEPDHIDDPTIDFGFYACLGTIGDFVWQDLNHNGKQDVGEPGIPNVLLELLDEHGASLGITATTDANGKYLFTGLCAGTYQVKVVSGVPPGYVATIVGDGSSPANDSNPNPSIVVLPTPNSHDLTIDFGYWQPAALGDFVWRDLNANGVQDAGEPGIPNVEVTLLDCDGAVLDTTTTDASGLYLFSDLVPGCYKVQFATPAGLTPSPSNQGGDDALDSDSVGGTTGSYTLASGETNLTVDAGFYEPAQLGDFVWNDLNINGTQDAGEPGIAGVQVSLYRCGEVIAVATTTTDANGLYLFPNLTPGCYYVTFATPAGFAPSPSNVGADTSDSDAVGGTTGNYTLNSGDSDLTVDAGFYQLASLGDLVWHDRNANGQQDAGEPGIPNVQVTLLNCDGTPTGLSATTNASGLYLFSNLTPGCYKVQFATPAGFAAASPANTGNDATDSDSVGGTTGNYTLAAGETNLTVDAGFYKLAELGDFVWKDLNANGIQDAGEPGIAGVLVTLLNCDNSPTGFTQLTNAAGNYLFTSLVPGCYKVQFATPAGLSATTPNVGLDTADSDPVGGVTGNYVLQSGDSNLTVDAGFVAPPPPCIPTTFTFSGNTATSGTKGNIRTFTVNGISVNASAFSRTDSGGTWYTAYLGLYSSGLGVTDGSEGDGSADRHKVDNIDGRDNYILFEFSQPVVVTQAFLNAIGADSDITVWIGTKNDPYTNHLTLSDALLASLTSETNLTTSTSARWAAFNGTGQVGNVLVIAAQHDDTTPEDAFKVNKLGIDCAGTPPPCVETTIALTGNSATSGTAGNIRTFTANGISVKASAFSRTDSGGTWNTAYLGAYSSGLGVTDGSEGSGGSDTHTADNMGGRDNYVLFEFSQPVIVNQAFLDYVGADSDITVWVGTKNDPYNNHLTLSDALLASLTSETNLTTSADSRWAQFNGTGISGNVVVIAPQHDDTTPEDSFKLSKLKIVCVGAPPPPPPPPPCVATTFVFSGNTAGSGTAGNIRTFTSNGISVKASAFSRRDDTGGWNTAYLGLFGPGLGVTDGSEGDGSSNRHKVDNIGGRNNYILFEFSEKVVITQAFLDAIGADSDVTVWIGTKNDPYNNHLTLSDALLASLTSEDDSTTSTSARWATFNGGKVSGNVLVISALVGDTTPEDAFKVSKLGIVCP